MSKGRNILGPHHPRDALSKRRNVRDFSFGDTLFGDTSFGDTSSWHRIFCSWHHVDIVLLLNLFSFYASGRHTHLHLRGSPVRQCCSLRQGYVLFLTGQSHIFFCKSLECNQFYSVPNPESDFFPSRILDPGSRVDKVPVSGSGFASKNLSIFKKLMLSSQNKIRNVYPGSRIWIFSIPDPGSRIWICNTGFFYLCADGNFVKMIIWYLRTKFYCITWIWNTSNLKIDNKKCYRYLFMYTRTSSKLSIKDFKNQ